MLERHIPTRALFTLVVSAGTALLSGCGGLERHPLAPHPVTGLQETGPSLSGHPVYLTLSRGAPLRAAKRVTGSEVYTQSASGWFSPGRDGELRVGFPRYADPGQVQVKRATFEVEEGSVGRRVEISMTAFSGTALEDVRIEFEPSGLAFSPPATLTLVLRGELDPGEVNVYHTEGSTVTRVSADFEDGEKTLTVVVKVPGFSTYSLGGDELLPPEGNHPGSP
ncbi:hypothetical protein HYY27_00875 [bacterium]|nr:hypothetical protein [bacterium]